ncbi:unnamed protein product [Rotaria sp. Silwood2]|nr:unnamed protein product [Rotaria sp. Silwood2]CAF4587089.1 unnamed protein product [Rotaria sp. Silwood2]
MRFRPPRIHGIASTIKQINVIILDIDMNHLVITDLQFQVKIFNEVEVDACVDYFKFVITDVYLLTSYTYTTDNILISMIRDYREVTLIYMFCKNEQYQNYSKLRSILTT